MRMLWTQQEMDILKKLAEQNYPVRKIAKVLKSRTLNAIRNKAEELGLYLGGGPAPEIDLEAFKKLIGGSDGSQRKQNN